MYEYIFIYCGNNAVQGGRVVGGWKEGCGSGGFIFLSYICRNKLVVENYEQS